MALLITVVFGDVVEVFTADNESTVHLGGHNGTGQDTATDGNETSEGALLICRPKKILESAICAWGIDMKRYIVMDGGSK